MMIILNIARTLTIINIGNLETTQKNKTKGKMKNRIFSEYMRNLMVNDRTMKNASQENVPSTFSINTPHNQWALPQSINHKEYKKTTTQKISPDLLEEP